jgi:ELWxxDGT repeat protein
MWTKAGPSRRCSGCKSALARTRTLRCERLEVRHALSGPAELVLDIAPGPVGSDPGNFVAVGDWTYFVANGGYGRELWKSDEHGLNATLVKDIRPGTESSSPRELTRIGDALFFAARLSSDPWTPGVLYRSDGTESGTTPVLSPAGTPFGISYEPSLVEFDGALFAVADDGSHGMEIWRIDPQTLASERIAGLLPGAGPLDLTVVGDRLYFSASDASGGRYLWSLADSDAVATLVPGFPTGSSLNYPAGLTDVDGTLFVATGWPSELWKTDGTPEGTVRVQTLPTTYIERGASFGLAGKFVYWQRNAQSLPTLWSIDGATSETTSLLTMTRGAVFWVPPIPAGAVLNDRLYFVVGDSQGTRLWSTDGTIAGTTLLKVINSASVVSVSTPAAGALVNVTGVLYFDADDGQSGRELWRTDGTAVGTYRASDIQPGPGGSEPHSLAAVQGALVFAANDGVSGAEMWRFDPATGKLSQGVDIGSGGATGYPKELTAVGDVVYFTADNGWTGREVWRSDGTVAGTYCVADIRPGSAGSDPKGLTRFGDKLFFFADSNDSTIGLWQSDGTAAGTALVKHVPHPFVQQFDGRLAIHGAETLFYFVANGATGSEVWVSDGTSEGTHRVSHVVWGAYTAIMTGPPMASIGDVLYYAHDDGVHGVELWRTDGTESGTYMFKETDPAPSMPISGTSNPAAIISVDGRLFFSASNGTRGAIWTSDGTAEGTSELFDATGGLSYLSPIYLTDVDGTLYFTALERQNSTNRTLFKSNGFVEGTVRVKEIPGSGMSLPRDLINVAGTLYFTSRNHTGSGHSLWKSDGTELGTVRIATISTDAADGYLTPFHANGNLYFAGLDAVHGRELWTSDGTEVGTHLLHDINLQPVHGWEQPTPGDSNPRQFVAAGARLFFQATDLRGVELWSMPLPPTPQSPGDFDGDADIDGADFLVWQRTLGAAASPHGSGADANRDGAVDASDLEQWRDAFNLSPAAPPSELAGASQLTFDGDVILSNALMPVTSLPKPRLKRSEHRPPQLGRLAREAALAQWIPSDSTERNASVGAADSDGTSEQVADDLWAGWPGLAEDGL